MGGALSGATTISGSSTVSGHALDIETVANVAGVLTAGSFTDGTATLTGGNLSAVGQLTASYAKIDVLDVNQINSITSTVSDLEVSDRRIISALSASSAAADGGGLRIGGGASTAGYASVLFDHGNSRLNINYGGSRVAHADASGFDVVGTISGSSTVSGHALDIETVANVAGVLTAGSVVGTTTVSGAAGTFNTFGAGAGGSGLSINAAGGIFIAGTQMTATAAELNYLDNDDLTAADITKLAAITATAAQLNFNVVTAGTAAANKTLVVDGNLDVGAVRNFSYTGNVSGSTLSVMGAAPASGIAIATPETWAVKAGQFITYSDGTLKKNVKQLDGAIEKVMSMRGVSYEMKKGAKGRKEVGFIAQEMKQLVPEVVYGDGDGNYGIDYGKITSVLVEAVKAQQSQIEELKALLKK